MPPSEQRTDTWDLLCLLGWFPCSGGRKGGLIQGFINLTVDCNSNLSYIGIVSGNRLRRRGRRQWVTATLLLLPALLPSTEVQKNGAARVGLIPSSRLESKGLVNSVQARKRQSCAIVHGHLSIRNTDDPAGTDVRTCAGPQRASGPFAQHPCPC